jgi:hypothetical protein
MNILLPELLLTYLTRVSGESNSYTELLITKSLMLVINCKKMTKFS